MVDKFLVRIGYTYDPAGNRIAKNGPEGKIEYAYTYDDLLARVDDAGKTKVTDYGYDGLNRRIFNGKREKGKRGRKKGTDLFTEKGDGFI